MAPSYVGALDQGTTSTRFILFDEAAHAVASHQLEFEQIQPHPGWVEHDPMTILQTARVCMEEALRKAAEGGCHVAGNVRAIGLTNQRETTLVWSKSTGRPLHNAIVWMDVRTTAICRRLEQSLEGGKDHFRASSGLPISTYFSAVKLLWLAENVPSVKEAIESGDALFGTVDSWLIWNMTGGCEKQGEGGEEVGTQRTTGVHVTDCSNAARTMLMDLQTLEWHKPHLEALNIPLSMMPKIISNAEIIGPIASSWPLAGVPIAGCLGDQHAAMLGQYCRKGEAKSTYGTGCFILLNTGDDIRISNHGLLTTIAYKLGPTAPVNYALEGSIAIAGAAVQWLRDSLGLIKTAPEIENLAKSVDSTGGVYFVPAFSGLFAPWWRDDARGVLVGITRYTSQGHIARAVLESMCFQARAVLQAMHSDAGSDGPPSSSSFLLRVDGGASANNLLMQLQADLLGSSVIRPANVETTALGAAYAAGLAVGVWTEGQIFEGAASAAEPTVFLPTIGEEEREKRAASWARAVERSFGLADLA